MFDNFEQVTKFFSQRKQFGIKPGLHRMQQLLQLLGNPQNKLRAVHVAGTNGKGSTIHFLKDGLKASGYRVGVFTSPSFCGLTGYIWIDDSSITEAALIRLLNDMYPAIRMLDEQNNHPTEFEIITALAFVYFVNRVDIAIIETGMGGREDTTNCFTPILSIITNVARDHMAFLGDTIQEIAAHKAGIIKQNRSVIVGVLEPAALVVVKHEAQRKHASIYQLTKDFWLTGTEQTDHSSMSFVWTDGTVNRHVSLTMKGQHQQQNAALAMMALTLLERNQYQIDWKKAIHAIGHTHVAGRFELVRQHPSVIIDGAHNIAGTASFIQTMLKHYPDQERHLIFAGFKDKELVKMLYRLKPYFASITLTSFDHPRAIAAAALYELTDDRTFAVNADWRDVAKKLNEQTDACFFFTGSLHFILEVRKYFLQE
ncbi:bifunctional folylpolyglutamate synthase/dihydrofolate synthase [Lentibacillus daqui]|uniref:bifunctional folylpolyglutamate synthase/dihydrofolate synthase n=1 Tax=Lentibacillus daqui TaxID=2911514 RepID=UPI0022B1C152|nr:folylpolyglutamate synthase/dihydrofolate synthase family protein [Lentibacillus daqui]